MCKLITLILPENHICTYLHAVFGNYFHLVNLYGVPLNTLPKTQQIKSGIDNHLISFL